MDMTENQELVSWLVRVEGKLDTSLQRVTTLEAETKDHARRVGKLEDEIDGGVGQTGLRQGVSALNQRLGVVEDLKHAAGSCDGAKMILTFKNEANGALKVGKLAVGFSRVVWACIIGIPTLIGIATVILSHWKM
jgi:hypothetical protein